MTSQEPPDPSPVADPNDTNPRAHPDAILLVLFAIFAAASLGVILTARRRRTVVEAADR